MTRSTWLDSDGEGRLQTPVFQSPPRPPKRGLKPWHWVVLGVLALVTMCVVLGAVVGNRPLPVDKPVPPYETTSTTKAGQASGVTAPPVAAPAPLNVKGKGNAVVPIGATLNGTFKVEYAFGSWCGAASFLKADGGEGAGFLEMINECADDVNHKATGSTIMHLKNATQVKTENTRGDWTLKLTPMG